MYAAEKTTSEHDLLLARTAAQPTAIAPCAEASAGCQLIAPSHLIMQHAGASRRVRRAHTFESERQNKQIRIQLNGTAGGRTDGQTETKTQGRHKQKHKGAKARTSPSPNSSMVPNGTSSWRGAGCWPTCSLQCPPRCCRCAARSLLCSSVSNCPTEGREG